MHWRKGLNMPKITDKYSYYYWGWTKSGKPTKRPVAGLQTADALFLHSVAEMYPDYTVRQLKEVLSDKKQWLYNPDVISCLNSLIEHGCGDSHF